MNKKIVIASLYADPLHIGHIEYLTKAKELGDKLIVIVNNDKQAKIKKGKSFMNGMERVIIIGSLKVVDDVVLSIDEDLSVCETTKMIWEQIEDEEIIFANGGDVKNENCREKEVCDNLGIKMIDGLGEKIQSSSWLLKEGVIKMENEKPEAGTPAGYNAGLGGQKIRSKGKGKGLGRGKGRGPIGVPKK